MRRALVILLLTGTLLAQRGGQGVPARAIPTPPLGTSSISGLVRVPGTLIPIADAEVQLLGPRDGRNAGQLTIQTDSSGRFILPNLAAGTYTVRASKKDYFIKGAIARTAPITSTVVQTDVTVADGQRSSDTVFELVPGGKVIGRVTDAQGRPAVVLVELDMVDYNPGYRVLTRVTSIQTDDRGDFRLSGILPSTYYLRAIPRAGSNAMTTTFFPSSRDVRGALTVKVESNKESIADIAGIAASSATVSGQVVGGETSVLTVQLAPRLAGVMDADTRNPLVFRSRGPSDGKFEISGVSPGTYDVYAQTGLTPGQVSLFGRTVVDVKDSDVRNLAISLSPAVDVSARVLPRWSRENLRLRAFDPLPGSLGQRQATENAQGEVQFAGVIEGRYVLEFNRGPQVNKYVAEIRQGGRSIYEDGVIRIGREKPEPLEITIATSGGQLEGIVQDATGKIVPIAIVTVVPEGRRRENPIFYLRSEAPGDGKFSIHGVPPGSYKIFAWESIPFGAEMNSTFLVPFESRGKSVTVTTGATLSNIAVPIIRSTP
jgi:hypothetical protein